MKIIVKDDNERVKVIQALRTAIGKLQSNFGNQDEISTVDTLYEIARNIIIEGGDGK